MHSSAAKSHLFPVPPKPTHLWTHLKPVICMSPSVPPQDPDPGQDLCLQGDLPAAVLGLGSHRR